MFRPSVKISKDMAELADRYLADSRVRLKSDVSSFPQEAMQTLMRYPWPGSIRELINVVKPAVLLCPEDQQMPDNLPRTIVLAPRHAGDVETLISPGVAVGRRLAVATLKRRAPNAIFTVHRRARTVGRSHHNLSCQNDFRRSLIQPK